MWGPFANTRTFYLNVGINNTHRRLEYLLTQGVCPAHVLVCNDDIYIRIIYPVYLYSDVYFEWIPLEVSFVLEYSYQESLSIDMTKVRQLDDQWSK